MKDNILPTDTSIAYAHLTIADLERSLEFYRDRVGFRQIEQHDGVVYLSPQEGQPGAAPLRLTELPGAQRRPSRTTGLFHIAIRLPDRAGLARTFRRMVEAGWRFSGASDHGVSEALYTVDPDGNGVELYSDRPQEEWRKNGNQVEMVTAPLDLEDLLAAGGSDRANSLPAGTDVGHIHLQVSSLDRARKFYHELLGLNITQENYPGALFMAAGDYHHHIGTNTWAGEGAPPPPEGTTGLRSFGLAIPDPKARESLARRVEQAGLPVDAVEGGYQTRDFDGIVVELV